jgi:hypothetical protein
VLEMLVAPSCSHLPPAVGFDEPDQIPYFHVS